VVAMTTSDKPASHRVDAVEPFPFTEINVCMYTVFHKNMALHF